MTNIYISCVDRLATRLLTFRASMMSGGKRRLYSVFYGILSRPKGIVKPEAKALVDWVFSSLCTFGCRLIFNRMERARIVNITTWRGAVATPIQKAILKNFVRIGKIREGDRNSFLTGHPDGSIVTKSFAPLAVYRIQKELWILAHLFLAPRHVSPDAPLRRGGSLPLMRARHTSFPESMQIPVV